MLRQHAKQVLAILETVIECIFSPSGILKEDALAGLQVCLDFLQGVENVAPPLLEKFRESIHALSLAEESSQTLFNRIKELKKGIKAQPMQLKVLFLPYKIQMWGVLSGIYQSAMADDNCIVQVVPVPYMELSKAQHGIVRQEKFCYEGNEFSQIVPIIYYEKYDFETECPDIVYMHNIYDGYNTMTQVDKRFWSSIVKQYTDMLVYVPYFIPSFVELVPQTAEYWFDMTGIANVDRLILAGDYLKKPALKEGIPKEKLLSLGSPKIDLVVETLKTAMEYPKEWEKRLGKRKVFFLNTLYHIGGVLPILERVLKLPTEFENTAVIWRPHPLTEVFIRQNYPEYLSAYGMLKYQIIKGEEGFKHIVLDETKDYMQALSRADVMLSDTSSLLNAFLFTGKPVIYLQSQMPQNSLLPKEAFHYYPQEESKWKELIQSLLAGEKTQDMRAYLENIYANTDGTSGEKIHERIKEDLLQKGELLT